MRTRIQVYTDTKTKRIAELMAAQAGMSLTDYCDEAIQQRILKEKSLKAQSIKKKRLAALKQAQRLREKIAQPLPYPVEIIREARTERDQHFTDNMR